MAATSLSAPQPERLNRALRWRRILLALPVEGATPTMIAILLVLQSHMDRDGVCWPSQATVAKAARTTPPTVSRLLKRAVRNGWLKRRRRPNPHRGYVYRAAVPLHLRPLMAMGKDDLRSTLARMAMSPDQQSLDEASRMNLRQDQPNSSQNYSRNPAEAVDPEASDQWTPLVSGLRPTKVAPILFGLLDDDDRAAVLAAHGKDGPLDPFDLVILPPEHLNGLLEKHASSLRIGGQTERDPT